MTSPPVTAREIEGAILVVLDRRGRGKSVCPSDVARALAEHWRPLMPDVRKVAQAMADRNQLRITQKGQPVDAATARGPIRLSHPEPQESD